MSAQFATDVQKAVGASGPQYALFAGQTSDAMPPGLDRAMEMASRGALPAEQFLATGWFQGPDGQWRYEIDDSGAEVTKIPSVGMPDRLDKILRHPEFFKAYPDLGQIMVHYKPQMGGGASYNTGTREMHLGRPSKDNPAVNQILHELQHAIQQREGFAGGSSPAWEMVQLRADPNDKDAAYQALENYFRQAGEVEAYDVEGRRNLGWAAKHRDPVLATPSNYQNMRFRRP